MLNNETFTVELKKRKEYVDSWLVKYLHRDNGIPAIIQEAMRYAVFNGGKRLRPIMVLEGAALAGANPDDFSAAACALELIHSYSLVHDDLPAMDNDDLRRGKPTCHIKYGEANAILAGDALLTAAFELLSQNNDAFAPAQILRVIQEIARAAGSQGMIGGQIMDLESENKDIDLETLKKLHSLKTGALFRAALKTGAILGNLDEDEIMALDRYGTYFGLAFQITDDILDITGKEELIGKPLGSDNKNHKTTYPSIMGLEKSRQMAEEAVAACIDSLLIFDQRADFLRNLAYYILSRES